MVSAARLSSVTDNLMKGGGYSPIKLSVTENGLAAETGLTMRISLWHSQIINSTSHVTVHFLGINLRLENYGGEFPGYKL